MNESQDKLSDHSLRPRNRKMLERPDGTGASSGTCSDTITVSIRVRQDRIEDIGFQTEGCPITVACASMATELAAGKHLDEAAEIAGETIIAALGPLPAEKRHCAANAAEALAAAIWDYVIAQLRHLHDGLRPPG